MRNILGMFIINLMIIVSANAIQIPTTNYVQSYLREYCGNPELSLSNVAPNKLPSEKYVFGAIDYINDCGEIFVLDDAGASIVPVVKAVRAATGWGLKESKEFVDSAPGATIDWLSYNDAVALCDNIKSVSDGAVCSYGVGGTECIADMARINNPISMEYFNDIVNNTLGYAPLCCRMSWMNDENIDMAVIANKWIIGNNCYIESGNIICADTYANGISECNNTICSCMIATESTDKCNFTLDNYGANKLKVLSAVRAATGWGLKESKDFVESVPGATIDYLSCTDAIAFCNEIKSVSDGAICSVTSGVEYGLPVEINRVFESNDACNAECATACAENAAYNTDGARGAIICGK